MTKEVFRNECVYEAIPTKVRERARIAIQTLIDLNINFMLERNGVKIASYDGLHLEVGKEDENDLIRLFFARMND